MREGRQLYNFTMKSIIQCSCFLNLHSNSSGTDSFNRTPEIGHHSWFLLRGSAKRHKHLLMLLCVCIWISLAVFLMHTKQTVALRTWNRYHRSWGSSRWKQMMIDSPCHERTYPLLPLLRFRTTIRRLRAWIFSTSKTFGIDFWTDKRSLSYRSKEDVINRVKKKFPSGESCTLTIFNCSLRLEKKNARNTYDYPVVFIFQLNPLENCFERQTFLCIVFRRGFEQQTLPTLWYRSVRWPPPQGTRMTCELLGKKKEHRLIRLIKASATMRRLNFTLGYFTWIWILFVDEWNLHCNCSWNPRAV